MRMQSVGLATVGVLALLACEAGPPVGGALPTDATVENARDTSMADAGSETNGNDGGDAGGDSDARDSDVRDSDARDSDRDSDRDGDDALPRDAGADAGPDAGMMDAALRPDGPTGMEDAHAPGCPEAGSSTGDTAGAPHLVEVTTVTGRDLVLGGHVTADAAGAAYLVGSFSWDVGFFPQTGQLLSTQPSGNRNGFVVKVDPRGVRAWARRIGSPDFDGVVELTAVAAAPTGEIVIAGWFLGTVDLDPGPAVDAHTGGAERNAFVLALSPKGERVWLRALDANTAFIIDKMKIAPDGSTYLVGMRVIGPGAGSVPTVSKLSPAGAVQWTKAFEATMNPATGRSGSAWPVDVAEGADGTVWIVGEFVTAADLDPGPGTDLRTKGLGQGDSDGFVVKLDGRDGTYRGGSTFGGAYDDHVKVVQTSGDAAYVAGDFQGTANFSLSGSALPLTAKPGSSVFVMRIDAGAASLPTWAIAMPERRTSLKAIAVRDGGVYLAGWWDATTAGTGSCGPVLGGLLVAKLRVQDGAVVWSTSTGPFDIDARAIVVGASQLLVGGTFSTISNTSPDSFQFDPFETGPGIASSAFLATYDL